MTAINLKLISGKKYSKSEQTKYSGFVKSGIRWAERDRSAVSTWPILTKKTLTNKTFCDWLEN